MLQAGLVGLPNVGKSTLFNALLSRQVANVANYPFCTIEPNVGVVEVPDERLAKLAEIVHSNKLVPAAIEFVDIAGLVEGAHKGEGLGNKFLANIREVDLILMVVRDFKDENVVKSGSTNPVNDVRILVTELMLADLQTLEKVKEVKANASKEEKSRWSATVKLRTALERGEKADTIELTEDEEKEIKSFGLLTRKPVIVIRNTDEEKLKKNVHILNYPTISLSAALEAQMTDMTREEKIELLNAYGIEHPVLDTLITQTYETLGLISFLTAGEKEVRAWPIVKGSLAPRAAGTIHTDFEHNFIKAKIVDYDDFVENNGWVGAKESGKMRLEGKEYEMREGDVVEFLVGN